MWASEDHPSEKISILWIFHNELTVSRHFQCYCVTVLPALWLDDIHKPMARNRLKVWCPPAHCLWGYRLQGRKPLISSTSVVLTLTSQLWCCSSVPGDGVSRFSRKLASCSQSSSRFISEVEHWSASIWWPCDLGRCWQHWRQHRGCRRLRQPLEVKPCPISGRRLGLNEQKLSWIW